MAPAPWIEQTRLLNVKHEYKMYNIVNYFKATKGYNLTLLKMTFGFNFELYPVEHFIIRVYNGLL